MSRSVMTLILGLVVFSYGVSAEASPDAYQRSYQLEAKKKYGEALVALEAVGASEKGSYFYLLRRGWLSYLAGKYHQAITSYDAAKRLRPKALEPLLGMTLPQMALRAWIDGVKAAKAALALDKDNYTASSRLALCEYHLGRYVSSMRRYRRILDLYPGNLTMRLGLAWAQLKAHKREVARRSFAEVLKRSPANASAKRGLALSR